LEQRQNAAAGRAEERLTGLALQTEEHTGWARQQAGNPGLGTLDNRRLTRLRDAWAAGVVYINGIIRSRQAGNQDG
jgi:hypothetical protein